ncbi:hypothetical protein QR680_005432 [Steinernema hermaphroditum]|uniref:PIH1 N-terminal domain-containing protein n=1 Tax=Steinernema hermaphroditum TaxID=289476 RepID=A0AA39HTA2_9BILA|nr:hypothetical protein QR680_005432 [Steinernema hermaphroditum]
MYGGGYDQNQSNAWFDPSASSQGWGQFDYSQTPSQQSQAPSTANNYYVNAQAQMNQDSIYGGGGQMFMPSQPSQKTVEEDFENEPPLLEELGINFDHIQQKTLAVLNPLGAASAEVIADQDLAGPLVFCLLFGASLLLHGKVHFGYIYGIGGLGCVGMYALLNLMAAEKSISFTCTASVLGYCLLPMALLSMIAAVLSFQGIVGYVIAGAAVLWCSSSSSKLFTITLAMEGQRILMVCIVETGSKGEETWVVRPTAGYVLKFKDVKQRVGMIRESCPDALQKVFVNVCHCNELPDVMNDLDEEECAKALSENPGFYKIPISVGEVETTTDNHGESSQKIDLIVNSTFFHKRLDVKSEFFRQLDFTKAIRLRNRKVMGELSTQNIRKRPAGSHVVDIQPESSHSENENKTEDETDISSPNRPRNYAINVVDETLMEIKIRVPDVNPPIADKSRLALKMNKDRLLVLFDKRSTVADLHLPIQVEFAKARSEFKPLTRTLVVEVPLAD